MNPSDTKYTAWDFLRDDSERWYEMNAYRSASGQANNNLNNADYLLTFAQYYPYGPKYYILGGYV